MGWVYELKLILSFTLASTLWVCGVGWVWALYSMHTHPSGLYSITVADNFDDLLYINLYERKLECVSNKNIATPCITG